MLLLSGCSRDEAPSAVLREYDNATGINIFIRYDDYTQASWAHVRRDLKFVDLGMFFRVYVGPQFFSTCSDFPYGRPQDFDADYELMSLTITGNESIERLKDWIGKIQLSGVGIRIGDDVPLNRVIDMLAVLHDHKIRPQVYAYEQIQGSDIYFKEEFLGPIPRVIPEQNNE